MIRDHHLVKVTYQFKRTVHGYDSYGDSNYYGVESAFSREVKYFVCPSYETITKAYVDRQFAFAFTADQQFSILETEYHPLSGLMLNHTW